MIWELDFISREDFVKHVENTIAAYGNNLEPYDLKKFNSNIIDPVKMIFDKSVYRASWEQIISNEIFRQRDKANTNSIGYFHQRIFQYINKCHVPDNGKEGGWDVVYRDNEGIILPDGDMVHTIYVEMKNKHNTMNSASAGKTYIKMQHQLLQDDDCACFLVEAIAKRSQNIKWETTVDSKKVSHRRIRRVSLDQFYAIITGKDDAFFKICMALPEIIDEVIASGTKIKAPNDTVIAELRNIASKTNISTDELSMAMSIYLLGFNTYNGFSKDGAVLKRLYEYAAGLNNI